MTRTCQGRCKVCDLGEYNESLRAEVETLDRMHRLALDQRDQARVERDRLADGIREVVDALDFAFSLNSPKYMGTQLGAAHRQARALLDVAVADRKDGQ